MMYPLVRDLAADGIPVVVTCRVLGFSPQAFYRWGQAPCSPRDRADAQLTNAIVDVHADDPEFGYRFIADELHAAGHQVGERRVWRLCSQHRVFSTHDAEGPSGRRQAARPGGARRSGATELHRPPARRPVADGHHRAPDRRGQAVPVRDQRRVLAPHRRLRRRGAHDGAVGDRRVTCGVGAPASRPGRGRPLRPRQSGWIQLVVATPHDGGVVWEGDLGGWRR